MSRHRYAFIAAIAGVLAGWSATSQAQLATCASIAADQERLACYDALAQRERTPELLTPATPLPPQEHVQPLPGPAPSDLETRWELRPDLKQGIFKLSPLAPLYALMHATNAPNSDPGSPTRSLSTPSDVQLDHVDAKLQLSLKTKAMENILGGNADLWFGYTQQ